jgi:DNA-binding MarR family transcriptional regulator
MSVYQEPDETASAGDPTLSRVGYLVKRVQVALRAAMDEAFRPLGLSVSQYAILEALLGIAASEATNATIARRCFITPQSANELIATMTESRLITRRASGGPRRITFSLTKRGRDTCVEARRLSLEIESRMLFGQTKEDRERLASLLDRCARALESGAVT